MPRLAVVASHPIQYQAPWFRALAQRVDVHVFYAHQQDARGQAAAGFNHEFEWDIPLLDGYSYEWLPNVSAAPSVDAFAGCDTPAIAAKLAAGRFDACLITGWYLKTYGQAIRTCMAMRLPILMRGDSHLAMPRSPFVSLAKYLPYRMMLTRMAAHLFVGQANRRYLKHYGVKDRQLFFTPHFVDNARFRESAAAARMNGDALAIRAEVGATPATTLFVMAAKLIDKKRPMDFIDAVARLNQAGESVRGLVVGSGPLEFGLRTRVRELGAPVNFVGFRNQTEIPAYYAAADALVLPSDGRETWGLVANEAMACGLPIITSHLVGCAADLAVGDAGATYPMGDVPALATLMRELSRRQQAGDPSMSRAASTRVDRYSCEAAVQGAMDALATATAVGQRAGRHVTNPRPTATASVRHD
jgi:glycosyltransferase involved in cell wall biosynthesis